MPIPLSIARARAMGRNSTISAASGGGTPASSSAPRTADGPPRAWAAKAGTASRIASRMVIALPNSRAARPASGPGHGGRLLDRPHAAGLLAAAGVARLLVVLVGPDLALHPAPLQELLEPPQGGPDVLPVVDPHPQ